jgi:hypothetical protein
MHSYLKGAACAGLAAALIASAPTAWSAPPTAAAVAQDHAAKLTELMERWDKANADFRAVYTKAKTNDERKAAMEKAPKPADHLPGFVELAEAAAGTETAAKAWVMVVKLGAQAEDPETLGVAVDALLRDHSGAKELGELADWINPIHSAIGAEKTEALVRGVIAKTSAPEVKGAFMFALANLIDDTNPAEGSERAKEVRTLMETVAKDFAEVKDARGRSIGKKAEGWLFEKDNLSVGKTAPEIEATDLSGVAFKLSDYRGKVVLLDFWGNW